MLSQKVIVKCLNLLVKNRKPTNKNTKRLADLRIIKKRTQHICSKTSFTIIHPQNSSLIQISIADFIIDLNEITGESIIARTSTTQKQEFLDQIAKNHYSY